MPRGQPPSHSMVVCDCLTLFVATVGPVDGPAARLVALFLGDNPAGVRGVTTPEELQRARRATRAHGRKRPEKFPPRATRRAEAQFDLLAIGEHPHFEIRAHPTVSPIMPDGHDDHLVLLSAAAFWHAEFFSTYNADLRRMKKFSGVQIGTPEQVLDLIDPIASE